MTAARLLTAPHPRRPIWRARGVVFATLATAVGIILAGALPAVAHDSLIETTPATGSVVETAPAMLVLRFRDNVLDLSSQVIVRDPVGDVVVDDEGVIEATTLSVPLPPDLVDGTYRIVWRVVAGDGHPLQGAFEFSVGVASEPLPSAVPSEGSFSETAAGDKDAGGTAAGNTALGSTAAVADGGDGASGGTLALAIGGGLAAVAAATAVLLWRRRPAAA